MTISLQHITKRYGAQTVVDDVSLEIDSGELFVLLGSSGSGKSTILRLIAGLLELDGGAVSLHGRDVTHLPPQQRGVGFVFQNYSLFRHMTVSDNIAFGLEIQKVPRPERDRRVRDLLGMIGLDSMGGRLPAQLSGGQQQRVALARALAPQPSVLLLDEPFGALDVKIRAQLRRRLRDIQQHLGVTTILVTHDQEEAFELGDRIGVIEGGKLLEIGKPSDLYRRPQHLFTATFLGMTNLLYGQRNGVQVHIGDAALNAPANTGHLTGQAVAVIVRPEQIALAPSADDLHGDVIGRGLIRQIEFAGAIERITVQMTTPTDEALHALMTADEVERAGLHIGQEVWVGLKQFHMIAAP
jgi:ABC-type Fe3+/spermidine/putrescine transport system ATPase subunit